MPILRKPNSAAKPRLSDLSGLQVCIMLPPSAETQLLISHLERIGCIAEVSWPIPQTLPVDVDIVIVTVEPEFRLQMSQLAQSLNAKSPPVIAVVEYEDPSTLQQVLELRAVAVIGRPVKPFGLLTNLMIARDNWQQKVDYVNQLSEAQSRKTSLSKVVVAKLLLMHQTDISDDKAHRIIQKMAMDTRRSLESVAEEIITGRASKELQTILEKIEGGKDG